MRNVTRKNRWRLKSYHNDLVVYYTLSVLSLLELLHLFHAIHVNIWLIPGERVRSPRFGRFGRWEVSWDEWGTPVIP